MTGRAKVRAAAYVGRWLRRAVPLAVVLTLASPAQALADPPRPSDIPAVAAYVELVPTSRGPKQAGAGSPRGRPLAPEVERLVRTRGGEDAALLERLATSPAYGAPSSDLRKEQTGPSGRATPPPSSNALSAAIRAGGDGGEGRLLGLLLVLTALTAVIGGVAAVRRRSSAAP